MQNKSSKARRRGTGLSGAIIFKTDKGIAVVSKWPRPRTKSQVKAKEPIIRAFTIAQYNFKYLTSNELQGWLSTTRQTPYLPRDLYTQHSFGRLWALNIPGIGVIYPMTTRNDVSEALDVLGQSEYALLVRGPDFWQPLPLGPEGKVLKSGGPTGGIFWGDGGGGGGGSAWTPPQPADWATTWNSSTFTTGNAVAGGIGLQLAPEGDERAAMLTRAAGDTDTGKVIGITNTAIMGWKKFVGLAAYNSTLNRAIAIGWYTANDSRNGNLAVAEFFNTQNITNVEKEDSFQGTGPLFLGIKTNSNEIEFWVGADPNFMVRWYTEPISQTLEAITHWGIVLNNDDGVTEPHSAVAFHEQAMVL